MKRIGVGALTAALACVPISRSARREGSTASEPVIHTEDVDRFYRIYDAAGGHPSADQLRHEYLDAGSDGLRQLAKLRNVSGTAIGKTLAERRAFFGGSCKSVVEYTRTGKTPGAW